MSFLAFFWPTGQLGVSLVDHSTFFLRRGGRRQIHVHGDDGDVVIAGQGAIVFPPWISE